MAHGRAGVTYQRGGGHPEERFPHHMACVECGLVLENPERWSESQMLACYGDEEGRILCQDCRKALNRRLARAALVDRSPPRRY